MKRAKRVGIVYREYINVVSEYICPHCKTMFQGAQIHKYVTRFSCRGCGNECMVDHRKTIKYDE